MYGALWRNYGCLDFIVSKRSLKRALLTMHAFLKQIEQLGYRVTISDRGETLVHKGDIQMKIELYEKSTRFERILRDYRLWYLIICGTTRCPGYRKVSGLDLTVLIGRQRL